VLVFDNWTGNADGRQCVFYRAMIRRDDLGGGHAGFVARMIDHAFNGPNWDFPESPLQGLYERRAVYDGVSAPDDFQPWLDQVFFSGGGDRIVPGRASHRDGLKVKRRARAAAGTLV
jgi:hypothetical protein